jgi:hypothetical protein
MVDWETELNNLVAAAEVAEMVLGTHGVDDQRVVLSVCATADQARRLRDAFYAGGLAKAT